MGYYKPDCYNQPEAFGLTIFSVIEGDADAYGFNQFVVWEDEKHRLYYATDWGCSCPAPWEWATSLDDLNPLTIETFEDFDTRLDEWGYSEYTSSGWAAEIQKNKVRTMMRVLRHLRDYEYHEKDCGVAGGFPHYAKECND